MKFKYRPEIDGLRAIAVLSVIIFHLELSFLPGGFLGVDIFFVISGFLITSIILEQEGKKQFSFIEFYKRRAKRILPALVFMLLCFIPLSWVLLLPDDLRDFGQSLVSSLFSISNILFWRESSGYFAPASELKPMLHTWSLGIEEQFYIVFPVILIFLLRVFNQLVFQIGMVGFLFSLVLSHYLSLYQANFSFYMIFSRFWELLIGGLVAYFLIKSTIKKAKYRYLSSVGFLIIVLSLIFFNESIIHPSFYTFIPIIGVCLILLFNDKKNIENRLLTAKPIIFIGLISYSLYLWHYPLLVFYKHYVISQHDTLGKLIVVSISFPIAYLSWKYIENLYRHSVWDIYKKIMFITGCLGVLIYGIYSEVTKGIPDRLSGFEKKILDSKNDYNPNKKKCGFYPKQKKLADACVVGNKNKLVGALIGDSHAEALSLSLSRELNTVNIGLLNFWHSSCPPIRKVRLLNKEIKYNHNCSAYNEQVFSYLKNQKNMDIVVMLGRYSAYFHGNKFDNHEGGIEPKSDARIINTENFDSSMSERERKNKLKVRYIESIRSFLDNDKKLILVYPVPEVGWNVPTFLAKHHFQPFANTNFNVSTSFNVFKERNNEIINLFDSIGEHNNLKRVYPHKVLCNTYMKGRCIASLNAKSLYYDDDHLSVYGSSLITPHILKAIQSFNVAKNIN